MDAAGGEDILWQNRLEGKTLAIFGMNQSSAARSIQNIRERSERHVEEWKKGLKNSEATYDTLGGWLKKYCELIKEVIYDSPAKTLFEIAPIRIIQQCLEHYEKDTDLNDQGRAGIQCANDRIIDFLKLDERNKIRADTWTYEAYTAIQGEQILDLLIDAATEGEYETFEEYEKCRSSLVFTYCSYLGRQVAPR